MSDFYFSCQNLAVGYNAKPLICDINIGVKRGEILTLIGPNGAGKSTILKTMAGQLSPLGGAVYLDGGDLSKSSRNQLARQMAVLFTDKVRPEYTTAFEMAAAGRYPYTGFFGRLTDEDKRITENVLKSVNALDLAEREFALLSDGQQQRVLLARALCQQPDIIILDEPTSFLDIRHKLELLNTLRRLAREQNIAVVLSLHELELALRVSDRIVCVGEGGIDRLGTPDEIFSGGYIGEFYGTGDRAFCEEYGCAELERITGDPEVFVIAGGGSGTAAFRALQRKGVPFATGIIHENDIDYPVARALAAVTISEQPFAPISDERFKQAIELIDHCKRVICTVEHFGEHNQPVKRLLEHAEKNGFIERI